MTRVKANSDVWVIQDDVAMLYRQQDQAWRLESRMPFDEFSGSAVALSSFALPDTCIFLNIAAPQTNTSPCNSPVWTGIAQDPLRLVHIPANPLHLQTLQTLRSTGKKVDVVLAQEPHHFLRGIRLQITEPRETTHLKHWVNAVNQGSNNWLAIMQLGFSLWLTPKPAYQLVRAIALTCTITAFAFGQWSAREQHGLKATQQTRSQQQPQALPERQPVVSFDNWATQIRKFGQDTRANIAELTIHWDQNGQVYSHVELNRDRKRVPKGCQLLGSKQAECQSTGDQP